MFYIRLKMRVKQYKKKCIEMRGTEGVLFFKCKSFYSIGFFIWFPHDDEDNKLAKYIYTRYKT